MLVALNAELDTGIAMNTDVMFSSATDLWATPKAFFDKYNAVHGFELDVCANDENAKCEKFYTVVEDGLTQEWTGNVWMNPPYGREIGKWVKKAFESVFVDKTAKKVVCLLPARTDTRWFHDFCTQGNIEFIKGRLKFGDCKNPAPFPSMVVIFGV